ncbi:class I SAM-dependent methyltransferase [Arhodomonas sp. AD133]|uniref:class I SAM-dependent methyltransferase n=1 Tax=Arhodomonas sp. AD133 TaxID=3415009 RepID=UPI003EBEFA00
MTTGGWYDTFAPFYDFGTLGDCFYRKARKSAISELALRPGATVFDVFCGTGTNFSLIRKQIGKDGDIVGIDGSDGMLARARARGERLGLADTALSLVRADLASRDGIERLRAAIRDVRPGHFLFTLGLTCLSNWRTFLGEIMDIAPDGARLSIMDVYSRRLTLGARLINWVGAADCRRPVWEELVRRGEGVAWREFRPFKVLDVSVFVASGTKAAGTR